MRAQGSHRDANMIATNARARLRRRNACQATKAKAGIESHQMTRLPLS